MPLIVILDDRATNRQIFSRLAASIEDGATVRAFADPQVALELFPELEKRLKVEEDTLSAQKEGSSLIKEEVGEQDIAAVVSRWTGVPVSKMLEGEVEKLIKMEERLRERVVGQEEAIVAVANTVRAARAGLQDPNRPLGSFLFLGPTGVGKTETARALAEFLFDDEQALVRIDMSEY